MTASMTMDIENTDKLSVFSNECKKMGIKILPPSINHSLMQFDVQDNSVRYGLGAIKNASQQSMVKINDEVSKNGPFQSLHDFAKRLDHDVLTKKNLENLAYSGAFGGESNEHEVSLSSEKIKSDSQENFFGDEFETYDHISLPSVPMWSNDLKLQKEFSSIGFYLTGHPLEDYKDLIERKGIISYQKLTEISDIKCKIAGTISYVMERRSRNGKRFAFVGLTDEDGPFEVTIFSNLLSRVREIIIPGASVILDLEVQREKNNQRLLTNSITPINDFLTQTLTKMKIYLEDSEVIGNIKSRLKRNGSSEVSICFLSINDKAHKVELSLGKNFYIDSPILSSIKDISGVSKIEEI